ncbi:ubiquitin carboxyl-terminal hydrolase 16 isoform X2 [Hoplias malabaricus]|uniref:ubiquitin carboxyl-terminal hydrolase 16 isoform X2 n=1 Tax=Hoplias malabaricus TaxID=27720 RepID=UPI003461AA6A
MGKKRVKDNSMDLSGATCTHIRKGIDHSLLKKLNLDTSWNLCQACEEETRSKDEAPPENDTNPEPPAVWMCLKCGHRGCGRLSENKHAIKHYEKPRSDTHCLVLSLDTWSVWCYICDDDVHYSSTGQLAQLVSNIKKNALSGSRPKNTARKMKKEEEEEEENESSVSVVTVDEVCEEEKENLPKQKDNRKTAKQNGVPKVEGAGSGAVAVKGFSNLGNTCFFNAVLQNLSQTVLLRQLLSEVKEEQSNLLLKPPPSSQLDPLLVQLPRPGSLTLAMCELLNEIQQTPKAVVTPRELFTQVCKKASRFKGFQQQDSQELLRYLLDGMRAEESTRVTAGILEALKNSGKTLDAEQKKIAKEYERNGGSRNFVDRVFGGEMTSTVMCKECKTISSVTEVFLDLSLPVADEAYRKKNQKKAIQQKSSVSEENRRGSGRGSGSPVINGDGDMPTGTGSKYQQKKAKKQAKKQAKNQKWQQKQGAKLTLDSLSNQNEENPSETPPPSVAEQEADEEGRAEKDTSQSLRSEAGEQCREDKAEEEEEEEEEEGKLAAAANTNHFSVLSEERTEEKDEGEEEEDEGGKISNHENEGDELANSVKALSLQVANEESLEEESEEKAAEYVVVNQDPELAFQALSTRAAPDRQECSVDACLYQFTEVEQLTQNNSLLCVTCTKKQNQSTVADSSKKNVYRDALKQMLISSPPPVLTLHLKRFQQVAYSVCKVNRHVQFPQVLDLAPFCSTKCKGVEEGQSQVLYSLYGIVEHSGTMRSGHYTAFIKTRPVTNAVLNGAGSAGEVAPPKGTWFHISDSSVHPVTEAKVQSSQAYLLFYERIS